jgi:hypothetical protein
MANNMTEALSTPDVTRFASIALTLGEPAIVLWLSIRGAKDQPLQAAV